MLSLCMLHKSAVPDEIPLTKGMRWEGARDGGYHKSVNNPLISEKYFLPQDFVIKDFTHYANYK
jgi:hypothetical protein